jgi:hypothetical protein
MKNAAHPKFQSDVAGTHKHLVQSGTAVSEVLTSAARNIQLIQSNAGAEIFTRNLDSLVPAFSPGGGAPYWFQQLPQLYSAQATSLMKSAADTFSELVRAQQTLMEMGSQSTLPGIQESADATTQTLRKFYSRRMTRQVIQFPDRRAA